MEYDVNCIETVILGGWVSNISNKDHPALAGTDDYFTLQILNTHTLEKTNLYNEILIKPNTCFPINKIHFNEFNSLICNSILNGNLQLTISYFKVTDYNCGFIKVLFKPDNLNSCWYISDNEYLNNIYVPVLKGNKIIEFDTIFGWERPDSVEVKVQQLKTTEITAVYTLTDSVITFYNDQIDLKNIFQWKLLDSDVWLDNNESMTITPGEYEFEFKEIDTYFKPDNITLNTLSKTNYNQSVKYYRIKESVTVNLNPPTIKLNKKFIINNQWCLRYFNGSKSPWYKSGETIYLNTDNIYTIEIEENSYITIPTIPIEFDLVYGHPMVFNVELEHA